MATSCTARRSSLNAVQQHGMGREDAPIGLHECRRTEVLVTVPPVRGATRGTASAEDTFVQAVQLRPKLLRLWDLSPPAHSDSLWISGTQR